MTDWIRPARTADAIMIALIYGHHVLNGTATFDADAPDADTWAAKIATVGARGWPFLVAEVGSKVAAFAFATQFRDRPAYVRTCENSIYIAADCMGQGLGTELLGALIGKAAAAGFDQMIAVIGGGEPASVALHSRLGFVERGRMVGVGLKFGKRLDTVYMQRGL